MTTFIPDPPTAGNSFIPDPPQGGGDFIPDPYPLRQGIIQDIKNVPQNVIGQQVQTGGGIMSLVAPLLAGAAMGDDPSLMREVGYEGLKQEAVRTGQGVAGVGRQMQANAPIQSPAVSIPASVASGVVKYGVAGAMAGPAGIATVGAADTGGNVYNSAYDRAVSQGEANPDEFARTRGMIAAPLGGAAAMISPPGMKPGYVNSALSMGGMSIANKAIEARLGEGRPIEVGEVIQEGLQGAAIGAGVHGVMEAPGRIAAAYQRQRPAAVAEVQQQTNLFDTPTSPTTAPTTEQATRSVGPIEPTQPRAKL